MQAEFDSDERQAPVNPRTFGFKKGHQTHDMVFLCNAALEMANIQKRPQYIIKIDIVKAFDRFYRSAILKVHDQKRYEPCTHEDTFENVGEREE